MNDLWQYVAAFVVCVATVYVAAMLFVMYLDGAFRWQRRDRDTGDAR